VGALDQAFYQKVEAVLAVDKQYLEYIKYLCTEVPLTLDVRFGLTSFGGDADG
jgi:hypothetical protein